MAASLWLGMLLPAAEAATVTLSSSADTSLFQFSPSNNLGSEGDIPAGTGALHSNQNRALFKFEIAGRIPSNAIITSAVLTLQVTAARADGPSSAFALHRMLQPWGEGKKSGRQGAPAGVGEATWNARFFPSTLWSKPGAAAPADFISTASGSAAIRSEGSYSFSSTSNLVADVQGWLRTPTNNFGWILISQSESIPGTARRFASRENSNSSLVPRLAIQYALPASAAPSIVEPSMAGNQFEFRFAAEAGRYYTVEFRQDFGVQDFLNWLVLTNLTASSTNVLVVQTNAVEPRRFYRVRSP